MAFLFKSKKQQERALASRDAPPAANSTTSSANRSIRDEKAALQRATPTGSLNSLGDDGSPDQSYARRGPSVDQPTPALQPSAAQQQQQLQQQQQQQQQPSQLQQASDLPFRNGPPSSNPNASLYPWSQRRLTYTTSHPSPFPRYGAAVNSVSSKEGDIYIMGGLINSSTVKGDLWMVEAGANMACYPLATTAEGPGPRVGHASLLVGNAYIVYGGDTKVDESDVLDETLYLLNTSTRQWSRALPSGPRPSGRYGHSLNILGSKIYVFGGQVEGYFMNDLCAFDLNQLSTANNGWELLIGNSDSVNPPQGPMPQARTNHTVVTFNDKLFLFGGTNGYQWFNDVWCYDPVVNKWVQFDCIGYIPIPREGHAATLVDDVMYIFGGRAEDGTDLGDLAAFRITTQRWYTFQNMGPSPSPRSGHSMTSVGKSIVVVGGEPSSATNSINDLGIVYVLDTSKIRYPSDAQSGPPQKPLSSQGRRPSTSDVNSPNTARQISSRDGPPDTRRLTSAGGPGPNVVPGQPNGFRGPPNGLDVNGSSGPAPHGNRGPPISSAPSGPPPSGPAPKKPPVSASNITASTIGRVRGPSAEREQAGALSRGQSPVVRDAPAKDGEASVTNGRRTPTQQQQQQQQQATRPGAKTTYSVATDPPKTKGPKSRSQGSVDSSTEPGLKVVTAAPRPASPPPPTRQASNPLSRRSSGRNSQTVALLKELDSSRNRNAWYASELELARKAGYMPSATLSPVLDSRATETFDDEDKPLIEALLAMRTELANVQSSVDKQAILAAKQIAEAEKQRDAAVQEAVYAKAKLAAHTSGSASSSPQLNTDRGDPDGNDRMGLLNKRLASSLNQQRELQTKAEIMKQELEAEKRARSLADETSDASQRRLTELESYKQQAATEIERLKSELHALQRETRELSLSSTEATAALQLLKAEKDEYETKYKSTVGQSNDHAQTVESLRLAVVSSTETKTVLERHLEEERSLREKTEAKLAKLKAEHETRTAELVAATQRLRDTEELAERHAQEAKSHKLAVLSGLDKLTTRDTTPSNTSESGRLAALQGQLDSTKELVLKYQQEANTAADKLRAAEERIAGLEAYQEQSSREGVAIRRQLQSSLREIQSLQAANSDLGRQVQSQQLETNAMAVQHNTLKDILVERGISPTTSGGASKSRGLGSPGTTSPDQARLRDLEQQLGAANSAHDETKRMLVTQLQESEALYRDKLAQLEQDYGSAVHYLKGTEKMLKKLKEEQTLYKAENKKLKGDVEELENRLQANDEMAAASTWESERKALQDKISELESELRNTSIQLEKRLAAITGELGETKRSRDDALKSAEEAARRITTNQRDVEQLQQENALLEQRAQDAEQKVSLLLDQVESSVDNYRRRSRIATEPPATNGTSALGHSRNESSEGESVYGSSNIDPRNSRALDNLANELDTLRTQWEATNKNYRLSNAFDFETNLGVKKDEDAGPTLGLSESLADWRKRLDVEEHENLSDDKTKARPDRP